MEQSAHPLAVVFPAVTGGSLHARFFSQRTVIEQQPVVGLLPERDLFAGEESAVSSPAQRVPVVCFHIFLMFWRRPSSPHGFFKKISLSTQTVGPVRQSAWWRLASESFPFLDRPYVRTSESTLGCCAH